MFFCHEILQRKNGSFGVIWLAAMQNKTLTRREYEKVVITKSCQEIIAYIMAKDKAGRRTTKKFSLYLSAQLMIGTVKVFHQQRKYLLLDCMEARKKLKVHNKKSMVDIPQSAVKDKKALCLAESFTELPFGMSDDSDLRPLLICPSATLLQETIDFLRDEEPREPTLPDATVNTAPKHAITMIEQTNADSTLYPDFHQVAPGMDLAPMDARELNQLLVEMDVSPIKHVPEQEMMVSPSQPEVEGMSGAALAAAVRDQLEQTPAIEPVGPAGDGVPSKQTKRSSADDETLTDVPPPPAKKSRKNIVLVLPPLEEDFSMTERAVRSTHLTIDTVIRISKDKCREWQENSDKTARPAILPSSQSSRVEDLMTTPGCQGNYNSVYMREWFARMCDTKQVTAVIPASSEEEETQRGKSESQVSELIRDNSASWMSGAVNASLLHHSATSRANQSGARPTAQTSHVGTPAAVPENLDEVPLPEQIEGIPEPVALPPAEIQDMMVDEQVMDAVTNIAPAIEPVDMAGNQAMESLNPSLIIQSGADAFNMEGAAPAVTPRSMSAKATLIRSIKAHTQTQDQVAFTNLNIIQAGSTSRQEVVRYFHTLLSLAKNRHVNLTQEEPYAPINISRITA